MRRLKCGAVKRFSHSSGALVIPITAVLNGVSAFDRSSNGCTAVTEVDSNLPVDASPSRVTTNENMVTTPLNYDPTTGTGDFSLTGYTGGKCNGAAFDSTGATEISSGTSHAVVSEGGDRVEIIIVTYRWAAAATPGIART